MLHHLVEVVQNLGAGGEPVHADVEPVGVLDAMAELARCHAIELGRLVQPHEGVGLVPVPAGSVVAIHHQYPGMRLFAEQRIDEGHGGCAGADDEVVGLECGGGHAIFSLGGAIPVKSTDQR